MKFSLAHVTTDPHGEHSHVTRKRHHGFEIAVFPVCMCVCVVVVDVLGLSMQCRGMDIGMA